MKALVVKDPFGGHERGNIITDPQRIEEILAGEHARRVSPTELEEPPVDVAPAEPAKKKSK